MSRLAWIALLVVSMVGCTGEQLGPAEPTLSINGRPRLIPGLDVSVGASWAATCVENDPTTDDEQYTACDIQPFSLAVECLGPGCGQFGREQQSPHSIRITPEAVGVVEIRATMVHAETGEVISDSLHVESVRPDRLGVTCWTQFAPTDTCNDSEVEADEAFVRIFAELDGERLGTPLLEANGMLPDVNYGFLDLSVLYPDQAVGAGVVVPGLYELDVKLGNVALQRVAIEAR